MSQRQVTLKDVCGYLMLENFIGHICGTKYVALSGLIVSLRLQGAYLQSSCTTYAVFSKLRDQLASVE